MIDPMSIAICTPAYDGKLGVPYVMGLTSLIAQRRFAVPYFLAHCSNIALARNRCVKWFLATGLEHLVFIDADIGYSVHDWEYLMEGPEDAVTCEYRKKDQTKKVRVLYGLGFARISRGVLDAMAEMRRDDGQDLLVRFRMEESEWIDYFPQGAFAAGTWRGEDHGFWLMAKLAGATVRLENRTRLMHTGDAHYIYRMEDFPDESSAYGDFGALSTDLPDPEPI